LKNPADDGPPLPSSVIDVGGVRLGNRAPLVVIGGLNVLEDPRTVSEVAAAFVSATRRWSMPFIFKASFDKANRSSKDSPRGPGLEEGLKLLGEIKARFGVPVLTDVHEVNQCAPVAELADILQIPAFLCRQTDLVLAAARTGRPIHIKKMQMMAPGDMVHIVGKCLAAGNEKVIVCERGTFFGYGNLVVDLLSFPELKKIGCPVTFDVTHALQLPGGRGAAAGGRAEHAEALALAGVSQGLAGLFVEAHPDPESAWCDGPSALALARLPGFLGRLRALDRLIKGGSGEFAAAATTEALPRV
jgi:2-dehydro-3-deoxyphosphooctonate aldolase (KDO 8-P synthase)